LGAAGAGAAGHLAQLKAMRAGWPKP
jgi:hypothetical protein